MRIDAISHRWLRDIIDIPYSVGLLLSLRLLYPEDTTTLYGIAILCKIIFQTLPFEIKRLCTIYTFCNSDAFLSYRNPYDTFWRTYFPDI